MVTEIQDSSSVVSLQDPRQDPGTQNAFGAPISTVCLVLAKASSLNLVMAGVKIRQN